jgi:transcriptional regulator with XRE-family HTH domain
MISQNISLLPLGQVVKAWRIARELSGTELAARAGLPKAYISQVEHNRIHHPGDENLARIASALEIPVEYLIVRRLPEKDTPTGTQRQSSKRERQIVESGFGFNAPDISKHNTVGRIHVLRELLKEIAEMNRRTEEIRQIVEEILKSEERGR